MFTWTASARTRVSANLAFAYLADPRHADQWFADALPGTVPAGPPHVGQTWRAAAVDARGQRSEQTIRLAVYDPPHCFVWQTTTARQGTTLAWELACAPADAAGTTLTLCMRWRVSPLGWPQAALGALIGRRTLPTRVQRIVARACAALEAAFPTPPGPQQQQAGAITASGRPTPPGQRRSARRGRRGR